MRGNLSKLNRATLSALVVMDVHARDTVTALAEEKIDGEPQHFSWLSQLRMYWEVRALRVSSCRAAGVPCSSCEQRLAAVSMLKPTCSWK